MSFQLKLLETLDFRLFLIRFFNIWYTDTSWRMAQYDTVSYGLCEASLGRELFVATAAGHARVVEKCLRRRADPWQRDSAGNVPLHLANEEVVPWQQTWTSFGKCRKVKQSKTVRKTQTQELIQSWKEFYWSVCSSTLARIKKKTTQKWFPTFRGICRQQLSGSPFAWCLPGSCRSQVWCLTKMPLQLTISMNVEYIKWYQIHERCQELEVSVSTFLSNLPQGIGRGRVLRTIWSPWAGRQGSKDTLDFKIVKDPTCTHHQWKFGKLNWREIWDIWILHSFATCSGKWSEFDDMLHADR